LNAPGTDHDLARRPSFTHLARDGIADAGAALPVEAVRPERLRRLRFLIIRIPPMPEVKNPMGHAGEAQIGPVKDAIIPWL
jgi:hypothetical protein